MDKLVLLLLLLGAKCQRDDLPSIYQQPKPDKCTRPAEFLYRQCCVFPPFFTREVAKVCGAFFEVVSIDKVNNITALRRHPMTLCDHWKCVLQKYDLLNPDDTLDDIKYYSHLDRWIKLNPAFSSVIGKAKNYCKNTYRMFLPLRVCEFFDIHSCIRNFVRVQCPVVFPTKECHELKVFFDECGEFYQ